MAQAVSVVLVGTMLCQSAATSPVQVEDSRPAPIPRPVELVPAPGVFKITKATAILVKSRQPEVTAIAEYLAAWLRARTGCPLPVRELTQDGATAAHILLATAAGHASLGDEYYALTVTPARVALFAGQPRGLFFGVQTLRQLLPPEAEQGAGLPAGTVRQLELPCVTINDRPRYRWRGMLLDCGRHFMTKEFIKRYIDLLAYHKLNVFHWHLTEDQGWRIEIRKYPRLTGIGAWREATRDSEQPRDAHGRYGGFYTQEEVKEIVAYARSRYVTIVPEIELPGHCQAALAAYPELSCTGGPFAVSTGWGVHEDVYCAGNEQTFAFLEDVLSEVLELFPSEYIHIGGDEVPKVRWKACPRCQARIQSEGLKDEAELQSYFIRRIERFLNSRGRRLIGWDEILEGGLAPNATVQSWRGMEGAVAAARAGHDVIASPTSHCYINFPQAPDPTAPDWMGLITLEQLYAFEPTPPELDAEQALHVLGAECNLWSEYAPQERVDCLAFPRLCALAELTWSPREQRDFGDFAQRLKTHLRRLEALGVQYYRPDASTRP